MASADVPAEPAAPVYDNFFSPRNRDFYAQSPYKPFYTHRQEIRLLKPLPITDDRVLSFMLIENCGLDRFRNKYITLSYCAGSPLVTEAVLVNGIKFNVFGNLHHALWEVVQNWEQKGNKWTDLLLWADQVCIDQSNGAERSHQVSQMRDIYASSERVLIVLATRSSVCPPNHGMRWMTQIMEELQARRSDGLADTFENPYENFPFGKWLREQVLDILFASDFQDFLEMLRSPWWTRSWIYQEFIVSPEAEFLFQGASIDWKDLGTILSHLLHRSTGIYGVTGRNNLDSNNSVSLDCDPPGPELKSVHRLQAFMDRYYYKDTSGLLKLALVMVQRKINWSERTDLKRWLDCGQLCEASDPRDKAYAFLGLAYESYNITPDYTPSNTEPMLLLNLAEKILASDRNLDLLTFVDTELAMSDRSKPSWVPDWFARRLKNEADTLRLCDQIEKRTLFISDHDTSEAVPMFPLSVVDADILRVTGIKLDTLHRSEFSTGHNRYESPKGFLFMHVQIRSALERISTCHIWWFPGTIFLIVLEQIGIHWYLVGTSNVELQMSRRDMDAKRIAKMIQEEDVEALLKIPGLSLESIEIH